MSLLILSSQTSLELDVDPGDIPPAWAEEGESVLINGERIPELSFDDLDEIPF